MRGDVDEGQPQAVGIEELDHARRCFSFALAVEGAAAITRPADARQREPAANGCFLERGGGELQPHTRSLDTLRL